VFMSLVAIVTPIATLTYSYAIVLPKEDSEAKGIIRLSLYIALLISSLIAIVLTLLGTPIVNLLHMEVLAPYLLFIPLMMLFESG
ncbi:teichoic acid transporter, partial [Staphylococcus sp. SIMBA_130]